MQFGGKVALITGGATAIGRASSRKFAAAGATVVVIDRDATGAAETIECIRQRGGTTEVAPIDVTVRGALESLVADIVARHGPIEFFHGNSSALGSAAPITSCDIEDFDSVIDLNVMSIFSALRCVLPVMVRGGRGSFVATCSIAALNGLARSPALVASSHAVLGLARAAALDVAAHGVTVNVICHGVAPAASLIEQQQAEEVADMAVFLCSSEARNITGAHFVVDGGQSAALQGAGDHTIPV